MARGRSRAPRQETDRDSAVTVLEQAGLPRDEAEELLDPMADAVECWLDEGIERAMSRFNR